MPNFSGNKNNLPNNSESSNLENISPNDTHDEEVSLFDLTKDNETKVINSTSSIPKTDSYKNVSLEIDRPPVTNDETKNLQPILSDNEKLSITRQYAQMPKQPINTPETNQENITQQHADDTTQTKQTIDKKPRTNTIKLVFRMTLFVLGSFIFVYLFLNFPALWKKLSYNYKERTGEKPQVQTIIPASTNEDLLFLSTVTLYDTPATDDKEEVKRGPTKDELGLRGIINNELWVPKIDVKAPIIWDSPVDEATMMENLKHGVVHYKGTSRPGESAQDGEGNVFISGHSSYYWWDDGGYKTVFTNLDQIEVGDEIGVGYDDYGYIYRVYEKTIVDPNDVSVLAQNTDKHTLTLMTCYPVGTNNKRLIVKAEFIARGKDEPEIIEEKNAKEVSTPTPASTSTSPQTINPTSIPSSSSKNFDVLDILPWNW